MSALSPEIEPDTFSIIVPAYNGASTIGDTLRSVLAQSYPRFELIVVDDASPDETGAIVRGFGDPRVRYIRHEVNRGAHEGWLTGLAASRGAFVACLDQDDVYHSQKLEEHLRLHTSKPGVGLSYNGRFEISNAGSAVRGIWHPPPSLTLADLVLGFPFAPSDMVIRREWAMREDIWADNETHEKGITIVNGAEYVYCSKLWFSGCRFAGVPRALNGRRHDAGRRFSHLAARCRAEIRCQETVFDDPRCQDDIRGLRPAALANTYVGFASLAFHQDDRELGYRCLREALALQPSLGAGSPALILEAFARRTSPVDTRDTEPMWRRVFDELPDDLAHLRSQADWLIAAILMTHGTRALMWDEAEVGRRNLERARVLGAAVDRSLAYRLRHQLSLLDRELGEAQASIVRDRWLEQLERFPSSVSLRTVLDEYLLDQAFDRYARGDYSHVAGSALRAVRKTPRHLLNRGLVSIAFRSVLWAARRAS
jgi:hypothetical protein